MILNLKSVDQFNLNERFFKCLKPKSLDTECISIEVSFIVFENENNWKHDRCTTIELERQRFFHQANLPAVCDYRLTRKVKRSINNLNTAFFSINHLFRVINEEIINFKNCTLFDYCEYVSSSEDTCEIFKFFSLSHILMHLIYHIEYTPLLMRLLEFSTIDNIEKWEQNGKHHCKDYIHIHSVEIIYLANCFVEISLDTQLLMNNNNNNVKQYSLINSCLNTNFFCWLKCLTTNTQPHNLCIDKYIQELSQLAAKQNSYTDIITFLNRFFIKNERNSIILLYVHTSNK